MNQTMRNWVMLSLIAPLLAGAVSAQSQEVQATLRAQTEAESKDYNITVNTNRDVYHGGDVLGLTVVLVNNDAKSARLNVSVRTSEPNEQDITAIAAGVLDGRDVDVALLPPRPPIIGVATLTRIGPSPVPQQVRGQPVPPPEPNVPQFVLPLFGRPVVPPHSSRIISAVNILVRLPEPNEPNEQSLAQLAGELPLEIIPAVGQFVAPAPGYYLLNCMILKLGDIGMAQAQKILMILPSPQPT